MKQESRHKFWSLWFPLILLFCFCFVCCYLVYLKPELTEAATSSDQLTIPAISKDLLQDFSKMRGWQFSRAPYLFPDFLIFTLSEFITRSFRASIFIFGFAQFFIFALSLSYLIRLGLTRLGENRLLVSVWVTIGMLGSLVLWMAGFDSFYFNHVALYSFLGATHFSAYSMSWVALAIFYRYLEKPDRRLLKLFFGVTFLSLLSDRIFAVYFILPFLVASPIFCWVRKGFVRVYFRFGWVILASVIGSFLVSPFINKQHSNISEIGVLESFWNFFSAVQLISKECGPTLILFWLIPTVFLLRKFWGIVKSYFYFDFKTLDRSLISSHWVVFSLASISISTLAVLVAGTFMDSGNFRYLMPLFFTPWAVLAYFLTQKLSLILSNVSNFRKAFRVVNGFVVGIIGTLLMGLFLWSLWGKSPEILTWQTPLAKCLLEAKEKYHLKEGLSEYWLARHTYAATGWKIPIHQITRGGEIYAWGNRIYDFIESSEDSKLWPEYNFIVMSRLDQDAIRSRFGQPQQVLDCGEKELVWIYSDPAAVYGALVSGNFSPFLDSLRKRGWTRFPGAVFSGGPHSLEGTSRVMAEGRDFEGDFIKSPALWMKKGDYLVSLEGDYGSDSGESSWKIVSHAGKNLILDESLVQPRKGSFQLDKELYLQSDISDVEMRILFSGKGLFRLRSVWIRSLKR